MPIVSTTIEIAAPPARVREVVSRRPCHFGPSRTITKPTTTPPCVLVQQFLDFDSYPEWSKSFFQSISIISQKTGEINQGDQLKVVLPGATFKPVILVGQGTLESIRLESKI